MVEEKIFTIPLRKAWRTSRKRRAKKAVILIKEFLERHMKGEVKIGKSINENVWTRGIQNPPRRVRIHASKDGNIIYSELIDVELKPLTEEEKKKKSEKQKEKEKKIKEERKERKKMSIQEEIEETGKQKAAPEEKKAETEKKEEKIEKEKEAAEKSDKAEEIGKA